MTNKKQSFLFIFLFSMLIGATILYGYTQFLNKTLISTVLQYQLDLNSPPESIFVISTYEQKFPDGEKIPKGTRFIGMLSREDVGYVIYFDAIQFLDGSRKNFSAKSVLSVEEKAATNGVSAKIGKTLYKQTKTNVLGAIFHNEGSNTNKSPSSVLPQGSVIKIEVNWYCELWQVFYLTENQNQKKLSQ